MQAALCQSLPLASGRVVAQRPSRRSAVVVRAEEAPKAAEKAPWSAPALKVRATGACGLLGARAGRPARSLDSGRPDAGAGGRQGRCRGLTAAQANRLALGPTPSHPPLTAPRATPLARSSVAAPVSAR